LAVFRLMTNSNLVAWNNGNAGRLFSLQDTTDIDASQAVIVRQIAAVARKPASLGEFTPLGDGGKFVARREFVDLVSPAN
jgi:hypothetical protein